MSIVAVILRVARGDKSALAQFGDTPRAFVQSLIPLIALPLVVGIAAMASGRVLQAVTDLLAAACALLIPAVVSHALARRWGREPRWLRFIVAFNWCQFALSALGMAMLLVLGTLSSGPAGTGESAAVLAVLVILCLALLGYGLWLPWFVARAGLDVSGGRAALLIATIYASTLAVLVGRGMLFMERG